MTLVASLLSAAAHADSFGEASRDPARGRRGSAHPACYPGEFQPTGGFADDATPLIHERLGRRGRLSSAEDGG